MGSRHLVISLFPTECRSNLVASVVLADVKICLVRLSRGCIRSNSRYDAQFMSLYCSGNPHSIVKVECGINRGTVVEE